MDAPSASIRILAQRLLDAEVASNSEPGSHVHEALRVYEKLRVALTRFAGAEGFTALMRRALTLARAEVPSLESAKVGTDGSMEGLEVISADSPDGGAAATVALAVHLLALLVTFIGEPLTLRLVSDVWPDAFLDR